MLFVGSAPALHIVCAADEAWGSALGRRLKRGRAQACEGWRQSARAGHGVAAHQLAPAGPIVALTAAKRFAIVLFTDLGDNREGARSRFLICYSAQRELFNGVLNVS